MKLEELFEALKKIAKERKRERRTKFGLNIEQSILLEFISINECFAHFKFKGELARKLRNQGKQVLTEKELILNGIKLRPDVCFFENGKWKIFEIEHNGGHKNKIITNTGKLSDIADIQIIDVPNTKFCLF